MNYNETNSLHSYFQGVTLKESKIIFMIIREHFRKSTQTNYGKIQIQTILDEIEQQYEKELE